MTLEVVTYANKSFGMFEELKNNEYEVPIKVLGWGTKWNGYSDKSRGLLEYMSTKKDDDIIIFIDGFDSKINKPIDDKLLDIFKQYDCGVLLSRSVIKEKPLIYFIERMFGKCGDYTGNAGMYMGYVKHLTMVLKDELNMTCSNDQVNLNTLCKRYDFIKVDSDEKIFKNFLPSSTKEDTDAYFISFPALPSFSRYMRGPQEYLQFFYLEIVLLLLIGGSLSPKYTRVLLGITMVLTLFYFFVADKSCV